MSDFSSSSPQESAGPTKQFVRSGGFKTSGCVQVIGALQDSDSQFIQFLSSLTQNDALLGDGSAFINYRNGRNRENVFEATADNATSAFLYAFRKDVNSREMIQLLLRQMKDGLAAAGATRPLDELALLSAELLCDMSASNHRPDISFLLSIPQFVPDVVAVLHNGFQGSRFDDADECGSGHRRIVQQLLLLIGNTAGHDASATRCVSKHESVIPVLAVILQRLTEILLRSANDRPNDDALHSAAVHALSALVQTHSPRRQWGCVPVSPVTNAQFDAIFVAVIESLATVSSASTSLPIAFRRLVKLAVALAENYPWGGGVRLPFRAVAVRKAVLKKECVRPGRHRRSMWSDTSDDSENDDIPREHGSEVWRPASKLTPNAVDEVQASTTAFERLVGALCIVGFEMADVPKESQLTALRGLGDILENTNPVVAGEVLRSYPNLVQLIADRLEALDTSETLQTVALLSIFQSLAERRLAVVVMKHAQPFLTILRYLLRLGSNGCLTEDAADALLVVLQCSDSEVLDALRTRFVECATTEVLSQLFQSLCSAPKSVDIPSRRLVTGFRRHALAQQRRLYESQLFPALLSSSSANQTNDVAGCDTSTSSERASHPLPQVSSEACVEALASIEPYQAFFSGPLGEACLTLFPNTVNPLHFQPPRRERVPKARARPNVDAESDFSSEFSTQPFTWGRPMTSTAPPSRAAVFHPGGHFDPFPQRPRSPMKSVAPSAWSGFGPPPDSRTADPPPHPAAPSASPTTSFLASFVQRWPPSLRRDESSSSASRTVYVSSILPDAIDENCIDLTFAAYSDDTSSKRLSLTIGLKQRKLQADEADEISFHWKCWFGPKVPHQDEELFLEGLDGTLDKDSHIFRVVVPVVNRPSVVSGPTKVKIAVRSSH